MDQKTYSGEAVASIIREQYIAVKVDHDAQPDLANRYRNYGWPATVILSSTGEDLVKRAGFIAPEKFAKLLRDVAKDPSPEARSKTRTVNQYATSEILSDDLQRSMACATW